MHIGRMEQGMAAAGVERARYVDKIAGAVQHQAAGPTLFKPRQQALFAPPPYEPRAGGLPLAGRAPLPKERHHMAQIAGLLSEIADDHV
jgi:hypothetical protein